MQNGWSHSVDFFGLAAAARRSSTVPPNQLGSGTKSAPSVP